jgi:hypothetical protein
MYNFKEEEKIQFYKILLERVRPREREYKYIFV